MKTVLTADDLHFKEDGRVRVQTYSHMDKVTGKEVKVSHTLQPGEYADIDDAVAKFNEWLDTKRPAARHGVSDTLSGMLDAWLRSSAKGWKPGGSTAADYRSKIDNYIAPILGREQVRDIDAPMIDDLYDALLAEGGRSRAGLSPNTVIVVHRILSSAFKWGFKRAMVDYNPMDYVVKPRPAEHEAIALDKPAVAVLTAALDDELAARPDGTRGIARRNRMFAVWLALMTGLRLGEVCALPRANVALSPGVASVRVSGTATERGGLRIVDAPKSASSRRSVPVADETAERIAEHFEWQRSYLGGLASRSDLLVCSATGRYPLRPSSVSAAFSRLRDDLGLPPGCTFHSLRHTFATWQLAGGAPLQEVSAMLGHANEAITLRIYAHVMPGLGAASAAAYAEAVRKAGEHGHPRD